MWPSIEAQSFPSLPMSRWLRIEREFIPLLMATILPILLLPSTASGDLKGEWLLFTLMAVVILQSMRSLPSLSTEKSSLLVLGAYRCLGGLSLLATAVFLRFGNDNGHTFKAMLVLQALFFLFTSVRLILLLARAPRVNGRTMAGAAAGYLLLGLSGGVLATTTQAFDSGAFLLGAVTTPQMALDRLTYYSFVTLAGLGYGDVLPGDAVGERFAILLSVSGTLYVVLLVGLLLGRFITSEEVRFLQIEEKEDGGRGTRSSGEHQRPAPPPP